jgi:hypothetical protein
MVVITRRRAPRSQFTLGQVANSPTMSLPGSKERVNAARIAAGEWTTAYPVGHRSPMLNKSLRGLGATAIPAWAPWAVGGVVLGGIVGWLVLK